MSQRVVHRIKEGAWGDGARLGLVLAWLLGALSCPDRLSGAFAGSGAALFAGAFVLGALAVCGLWTLCRARGGEGPEPRPARRWGGAVGKALPLASFALFASVAATGAWFVLAGPVPLALAALGGFVAGVGEGSALLAVAARLRAGSPADALRAMGVAAAMAALFVGVIVCTAPDLRVLWGLLSLVALATGVACLLKEDRAVWTGADGDGSCASFSAADRPLAVLKEGLWEPALGFGLSLMSALLPWGAFLSGEAASTPPAWSFAVGMGAAAICLVGAARTRLARVPLEAAVHVAMPVLAAAVVALRMLGDVGSSDAVLVAVKGVASGLTSVGFAAFAWFAMGRAARARGGCVLPYAVGMLLAFGVGAVILPLHGLNQSVASLAAPALSLVFLVVASCSSLGHLGHRGAAGVAEAPAGPEPLGAEEAARLLAGERGLSPRETEVLVRLASGRTAEGIAEVLGISPNTVRAHVRSIHEKLQVSSRDQVVDAIEAVRGPADGRSPRSDQQ